MAREGWQMWRGALSSEQVAKIIRAARNRDRERATAERYIGESPGARKSSIAWLTDQVWIRNLLYEYVLEANRNAFGVDVTNFATLQFTEYHGSEKGGYEWHSDVHWNYDKAFDRKVSITVQLSSPEDYEGGDLEFADWASPTEAKAKGTVIVFPSYVTHRVTPVTSGVRKSLVAWFEGPRWR